MPDDKYKSDFKEMTDENFLKFSKTKQGKKDIKQQSCRQDLISRGYTPDRARQMCEGGLLKTMASDVKKGVKKVASKIKKKK